MHEKLKINESLIYSFNITSISNLKFIYFLYTSINNYSNTITAIVFSIQSILIFLFYDISQYHDFVSANWTFF